MAHDIQQKVLGIFTELVGERAAALDGARPGDATTRFADALSDEHPAERAHDIAFHLTDWNSDAAFVVAALLFPGRFTPEELQDGIRAFLIHAPNHVAAAAFLSGWPIQDIFGVGFMKRGGSEIS